MDTVGVGGGCADPDPEFERGGVLPEGVGGPREMWARRGVVGGWLLLRPALKKSEKNTRQKKDEKVPAADELAVGPPLEGSEVKVDTIGLSVGNSICI